MSGHSRIAAIRLTAAALAEVRTAAHTYEALRPGFGAVFQRRLNETLAHIAEHPESYQCVNSRYRRAFLTRFPFMVVYRILSEGVEVVAVLPQRDNPANLFGRTSG